MARGNSKTPHWALFFLILLFVMPAGAFAQDRDVCLEREGTRSIEACNRVIASNQLAGKDLATIYVLRASIYRANKDYPRAIEDITRAIDLLTSTASKDVVASAYVTRASIYSLSGDQTKALTDYQQALALDATNAQAAQGARDLREQLVASAPGTLDNQSPQQFTPPNEPLPPEIPIPQTILQLLQTDRFLANAPPVRIAGYSTEQLTSSTVNGFYGTTSNGYDTTIKWLRQGMMYDQTIMQSESTYGGLTRMKTKTSSIGIANGLVGLGYQNTGTSYVSNMKPINSTTRNIVEYIKNMQGAIFPMRVGNKFSYEAAFRVVSSYQAEDEMTLSESCEITQQYEARHFHPDLTGIAYLEDCQDQMSYKRNKAADTIMESRSFFFDQLGISIRVDPQSPPQHIIQTYFKDGTTETARLQSFIMAR
jgi:tetratricopeptide (TPR) repeat protein